MKNLLLFVVILTACLLAVNAQATPNGVGIFKNSKVLTDPTLEWVDRIEQMDPTSDSLKREIATLQKSEDPESLARLGYLYLYGLGVEKNNKNNGIALNDYIQPAAEQGNALGQYLLAQIRFNDFRVINSMGDIGGIPKDVDRAMELLDKSARSGFAPAQDQLANIYLNGKIVSKDEAKGLDWFKKAANQGFVLSQNALGNIYLYGNVVDRDISKAKSWHQKAAETGFAPSQVSLGSIYYSEKKNKEALKWIRKAVDQNYPGGQYSLGVLYLNGKLVERSKEKAIKWLTKAAQQGNLNASYSLYHAYRSEDDKSTDDDKDDSEEVNFITLIDEEDQKEAMEWLKIAADNRHPQALAQIGDLYIHSRHKGTEKITQGLRYLEALEYDMGNRPLPPNILQKMAEGYDWNGNYTKAIKYNTKLAEMDHVPEQYKYSQVQAHVRIGSYYLKGNGASKNIAQANRWFEKAIALDHTSIDFILEVEQEYYSVDDPDWTYFATGRNGVRFYYLPKTVKNYNLLYNDLLKVLIKKQEASGKTVSITGWTMANNIPEIDMSRSPDKVQYEVAIQDFGYKKSSAGYKFQSKEDNRSNYREIEQGEAVYELKKRIWD